MSQVTSESILTTKEIVEQAIKDYHKQILPYLNGEFPTPIANKFDKANMYSTDEQIVGRWIDGKPLYQKVITGVTLSNGQIVSFGLSDIEEQVFCRLIKAKKSSDNNWYRNTYYNAQNDFLSLLPGESGGVFVIIGGNTNYTDASFVVQYTKTTDSAIEIGSDTDYSTTEKVIGTWIDGKPLYQKSYELQNFAADGHYHVIDSTMTNISVKKRWMTNNTWFNAINDYSGFIVTDVDSSGLKLMYSSSYGGKGNCVVTIQYTKTTD